jgi:hypothetical protein
MGALSQPPAEAFQVCHGALEHFIAHAADSSNRRPDLDIRYQSHALKLLAVGPAHVVSGEGDAEPTWKYETRHVAVCAVVDVPMNVVPLRP